MGGVPSSSLSVERLQGAEVVSAHLRISGGSRPAELFSDGYISWVLCDPQNSREFSVEFSFISTYNFIMPESYTRFETYNIELSEIHAFFTVSFLYIYLLPMTSSWHFSILLQLEALFVSSEADHYLVAQSLHFNFQ